MTDLINGSAIKYKALLAETLCEKELATTLLLPFSRRTSISIAVRACPAASLASRINGLQEEQHGHGPGKREGKQKCKSDKRITGKGNIATLCTNLAD
jgi:hypothetical protein